MTCLRAQRIEIDWIDLSSFIGSIITIADLSFFFFFYRDWSRYKYWIGTSLANMNRLISCVICSGSQSAVCCKFCSYLAKWCLTPTQQRGPFYSFSVREMCRSLSKMNSSAEQQVGKGQQCITSYIWVHSGTFSSISCKGHEVTKIWKLWIQDNKKKTWYIL